MQKNRKEAEKIAYSDHNTKLTNGTIETRAERDMTTGAKHGREDLPHSEHPQRVESLYGHMWSDKEMRSRRKAL